MAWQRIIPFGYRMSQGEIVIEPQEAEAIRDIFRQYLNGASLNRIAEEMTRRGVRYHERAGSWNKNMVHRILENERYLGDGGYPCIIDSETYVAVQLRKKEQNFYSPVPTEIAPIRKKTVCASCGGIVHRDTKAHGKTRWKCRNSACGRSFTLADNQVIAEVEQCLDTLMQDPEQLRMRKDVERKVGIDSLKIQNELTAAFNRSVESGAYIRTLIYAAAAERYQSIPDLMLNHDIDMLIERMEQGNNTQELRHDLIETAVRAIRIGDGATVSLELVNGKEIASI